MSAACRLQLRCKNYKRVKEIFKTGMAMTFGIGVVLTVIFWLGANGLVSFFTPLPEVITQGATVLRITIFSFLVLGPQMLASTGIQAFGKAKESLILSVARQGVVYIPLLFAMQSLLDFKGLIWAQPIADAITLGIGLVFLAAILKKYTAEKVEPSESDSVSDKVIYLENESGAGEIQEEVAET